MGQDTIQKLPSTSPVEVTVTILGIGDPGQIQPWQHPKNNVAIFNIAGTTPEISYFDVMTIRHQTILYLKYLIDRPDTVKPEYTKEKILEQIDKVDKFVRPDKIFYDKDDKSMFFDDHLDDAIQTLAEIRKSINESQTDPGVKKNLLEAVDDRIQAFAQAAEPANLPNPPPVKHVDYMWVIFIIVVVGIAVVFVAGTVRRRARRHSTPA